MSIKKLFIVVVLLFVAGGCASFSGGGKKAKSAAEMENTPERKASNAVLAEGRDALTNGLYDRSGDLFQEAINIDPSNGAAYYYLSFVKVRGGEYGEAEGLFEKADSLLSSDPAWKTKLDSLRDELTQKAPR